MSRWYMNDEQQRGYDDRRDEGRCARYPYSEDYDYRRGWEEREREERREREREEERRHEEEMEERRAYERSMERIMEEEEYYASMAQQQPEMPDANPHVCPECDWQCACSDQPCSCCNGSSAALAEGGGHE